MSADVIDLAARRRKALVSSLPVLPVPSPAREPGRVAIAMQATAGRVRAVFGDATGGVEVFVTPEQAESIGRDFIRFARVARGLPPDGDPA